MSYTVLLYSGLSPSEVKAHIHQEGFRQEQGFLGYHTKPGTKTPHVRVNELRILPPFLQERGDIQSMVEVGDFESTRNRIRSQYATALRAFRQTLKVIGVTDGSGQEVDLEEVLAVSLQHR
ncbi:hypothetical protein HYS48_00385 [Candidatus Woesearchaeota archaeon]|nr:hypothetical protein [Candidatus Woesearchaeota archaeon]